MPGDGGDVGWGYLIPLHMQGNICCVQTAKRLKAITASGQEECSPTNGQNGFEVFYAYSLCRCVILLPVSKCGSNHESNTKGKRPEGGPLQPLLQPFQNH